MKKGILKVFSVLLLLCLVAPFSAAQSDEAAHDRLIRFLESDADFIVLELTESLTGLCDITQDDSECVRVTDTSLIGSHGYNQSAARELSLTEMVHWGASSMQEVMIRGRPYVRLMTKSGSTSGLLDHSEAAASYENYQSAFRENSWDPHPIGIYSDDQDRLRYSVSLGDKRLFPSLFSEQLKFLGYVAPEIPDPIPFSENDTVGLATYSFDDFDALAIIQSRGWGQPLGMRAEIIGGEISFFIEGFFTIYDEHTTTPHGFTILSEGIRVDVDEVATVANHHRNELRGSSQHYIEAPISRETARSLAQSDEDLRVRFRMVQMNKDFEATSSEVFGFDTVYRAVEIIEPYLE